MPAVDMNLQVWLATVPDSHPSIVIPYVRGTQDDTLHYHLDAIRQGRSGVSRISQGGEVQLQARQATALTRFSLALGPDDSCRIELVLVNSHDASATYHFDCPRAG